MRKETIDLVIEFEDDLKSIFDNYDPEGVLGELKLSVEYKYHKGEEGINTLPNGDPGFPDSSPRIEICSIKIYNKEYLQEFTINVIEKLQEQIYNTIR